MRRYLLILDFAVACLTVAIVLGAFKVHSQQAQIDELARDNHASICELDAVLLAKARKDKAGAMGILAANPTGVPGFPVETILAAIADDNALIRATSDPTCKETP